MLLKATMRAKRSVPVSVSPLNLFRQVHTYPGKNYVVPENLKDCVSYLDKRRPVYTCLYFRASWNPYCERIQKDYETFCNENAGWDHVMVDCDAAP